MRFVRDLRRVAALLLALLVAIPVVAPELRLCVSGGLCTPASMTSVCSAATPSLNDFGRASLDACCTGAAHSSAIVDRGRSHETKCSTSCEGPQVERGSIQTSNAQRDDCLRCCLSVSDPSTSAQGPLWPTLDLPTAEVAPKTELSAPSEPSQLVAAAPLLPERRREPSPTDSRAPPAPSLV